MRDDVAAGRTAEVVTRFPPEPNGYLHIGHAKSIVLNFGVAGEFGGRCHLRFDDTNPVKEETAFIDSIQADVRWLGYDWGEHLHFASDHFERLYEWAEHLVREGKAYVDDSSADEIRAMRGTLTEPGTESPFRDRPARENLDLLRRMRAGEFEEGSRVLRARIDMASGNVNLRDPVLYRILKASHPRTGDAWCIYPTYDFAHGQSDAIEGVTHSLCTLEFADHRPLYDWLIDNLPVPSRPRQYEFARLNLAHTVLSKRRLIRLVEEGHVAGWDDPRMPTLAGLRRRGVPPEAIRDFVRRVGVARADNLVDPALLDHCIREGLNATAERRLAVLRPLKVVIENWPEGETEMLPARNNPNDPDAGSREIPFSAAKSGSSGTTSWRIRRGRFHRLAPGREVRLRYAYFVTCTGVEKGADGEPALLRCTYDPATRGGDAPDGRKVRGTIHWVSAAHAVPAEVRLYDHLFSVPEPGAGGDFLDDLNPDSLNRAERLHGRALAGRAGRCAGPVRAPGLFPARSRLAARQARLQPGRGAARLVGEDPGEGGLMPKTPDYFEGKTVLITGAASGIGRATAEIFAREGANVVASDIDAAGAAETAAGKAAIAVAADVTDRAAVDAAVAAGIEAFGGIDFLFNSAGAAGRRSPFLDIDAALWRETYALNVDGTFHAMQAVLPHMLERGVGRDRQHGEHGAPPRRAGAFGPLRLGQGRGGDDDHGRRARVRGPGHSRALHLARAHRHPLPGRRRDLARTCRADAGRRADEALRHAGGDRRARPVPLFRRLPLHDRRHGVRERRRRLAVRTPPRVEPMAAIL